MIQRIILIFRYFSTENENLKIFLLVTLVFGDYCVD